MNINWAIVYRPAVPQPATPPSVLQEAQLVELQIDEYRGFETAWAWYRALIVMSGPQGWRATGLFFAKSLQVPGESLLNERSPSVDARNRDLLSCTLRESPLLVVDEQLPQNVTSLHPRGAFEGAFRPRAQAVLINARVSNKEAWGRNAAADINSPFISPSEQRRHSRQPCRC